MREKTGFGGKLLRQSTKWIEAGGMFIRCRISNRPFGEVSSLLKTVLLLISDSRSDQETKSCSGMTCELVTDHWRTSSLGFIDVLEMVG